MWWSTACFGQCILLPLKTLRTGWVQDVTRLNNGGLLGTLYMVVHLAGFIGALIIAPLLVCESKGGLDTAILFAAYHFTAGFFFGVFSQASHLNPDSVEASYKVISRKEAGAGHRPEGRD
jgi:hypothetical protein